MLDGSRNLRRHKKLASLALRREIRLLIAVYPALRRLQERSRLTKEN